MRYLRPLARAVFAFNVFMSAAASVSAFDHVSTPSVARADSANGDNTDKAAFTPITLPAHPRLLARPADFERIRNSVTQPGPMKDVFDAVLKTAEREYALPPLQRVVVGRRLLATSRDALRRISNAAMLYQLTHDKKWAARAEQEMLSLAAFTDWNPSHFLDTAEAATAVAIGYDWLYETLSPETRVTLRAALVKHALIPGDDAKLGWRRGRPNNWRQVCETGLALAALSLDGEEPELAARALKRARENVLPIFETYEPDGAYLEGPMYWEYGTTYHVLLIEALRTATGSAGALAQNEAFLKSAGIVNLLTTPSGKFFNYADTQDRRGFSPAMYWFARETNQPGDVGGEHELLTGFLKNKSLRPDGPFLPRFLPFALLWMNPGPAAARTPLPESWSTQGRNPLALFRRGTGPDSLFAAIKGGSPSLSHAHMDGGSFILETHGVRWTTDLGQPDYNHLEQAGIDLFGKDRWKVYALAEKSHCIPLIDDRPPEVKPTAMLSAFSAETQSATVDLTPLYASQVEQLHRTLRIEKPDTLVVRDEISGARAGARYRFSWMTTADVATDANGATLRAHGKTLRIDITADAAFEIVNEDATKQLSSFDAPQPGLRRISVLFTVEKPTHFVEVKAAVK